MRRASRRRADRRAAAPRGPARRARRGGPRAPRGPHGAEWSGLGRAFPADADDRGVSEVRAEALLAPQAPSQRLQKAQRDLLFGAAAAADEVTVALDVRAVPSGHAVVEVGVRDVPELLERLEVAIDGGRVDLRIP